MTTHSVAFTRLFDFSIKKYRSLISTALNLFCRHQFFVESNEPVVTTDKDEGLSIQNLPLILIILVLAVGMNFETSFTLTMKKCQWNQIKSIICLHLIVFQKC